MDVTRKPGGLVVVGSNPAAPTNIPRSFPVNQGVHAHDTGDTTEC